MINRFGDLAQSNQISRLLLEAQTRTRELQTQLGSNHVADRFGDLGNTAKQLLDSKAVLQKTRQFQSDNALVQGRLQAMEGAVGKLGEAGTRVRNLLLQRLSDGSAGPPGMVAAEAQLMLDQVVGLLNTDQDGRYLFAGSRTDAPPVVLDPAFANLGAPDDTYYQGDAIQLSVLADDGVPVAYGMTADRPGFQQLIGGLRAAIEGDGSDDPALLESALDLLNGSIATVAEYRGEIGARQIQLDQINQAHADTEVYLEQRISGIQNVDIADAVTRLTQDQVALEAAMATIGRLSQLSLVDFIR